MLRVVSNSPQNTEATYQTHWLLGISLHLSISFIQTP
jgi:hypothetical protein